LFLPSEVSGLVARLGLREHPEGGWYKETLRVPRMLATDRGARNLATLIYYLLPRGVVSRKHRVAWDETWIFQSGGILNLHSYDGDVVKTEQLGMTAESLPQITIPAGVWFNAEVADGDYVLAACLVSPGFDFADLEMV
jgi:predicted cupin superfamily sugar epimerase